MFLLLAISCMDREIVDSGDDTPRLEVPAAGEGFQLEFHSTVEPYTESWDCAVYEIPIDEVHNVNSVQYLNNEGTHHVTLSSLGFNSAGELDPGMYDCNDLYTQGTVMESAAMIWGNQGEGEGVMQLPEGVAAQLPPNMTLIHELHYVNTTDETIELYSYVNALTIRDSEVVNGIWGGSIRDEHLNLPAEGLHSEWSRCEFNRDVEVIFLASHTHELGVKFEVRRWNGTEVSDVFYENTDWHDPKIVQYDPPMVIPQGEGYEFTCTWDNTRGEELHYGLTSLDEMCNLAVVHTPFDMDALCEVVETSDGVLYKP